MDSSLNLAIASPTSNTSSSLLNNNNNNDGIGLVNSSTTTEGNDVITPVVSLGVEEGIVEVTLAVETGMELLSRVLKLCPGIVPAYVELSRVHVGLGQFEEASRVLQQCLVSLL